MLQSGISIAPAFSVSVNLQDLPVVLVIGAALAALLLENIPTLAFLAIYLACRLLQKRKLRRQFQKTRIDNL